MKEIILKLIEFASRKGLGDLCVLLALFAVFLSVLNSMGMHPLDFSHGIVRDVKAAVVQKEGDE